MEPYTPTQANQNLALRALALKTAMDFYDYRGEVEEIDRLIEAARKVEAYLRGPDAKPEEN